MKVNVTVTSRDESRTYSADILTADWRQVMNEIRKGRRVVGILNLSYVRLDGDLRNFRVGNEKDTGVWLERRFKEWAKRHPVPAKDGAK